jgi:uncharacterized protein (UPF0276 family)
MTIDVSLSLNNLSDFPLYADALERSGLPEELPFVEILWDNYCHLNPEALLQYVSPFSAHLSLHVMTSKFLERSEEEFDEYLDLLAEHVRFIKPIRVSDHLARFRLNDLNLIIPQEYSYMDVDAVCARIDRYQERLRMPLLLENYASTEEVGKGQIDFFDQIMSRTGCGVLFDVSNAVLAELNEVTPLLEWLSLLAGRPLHCHVGGYAFNEKTQRYHDTHNSDLSHETAVALELLVQQCDIKSVCYERDYRKSVESLRRDLKVIQASVERSEHHKRFPGSDGSASCA